MKNALIIILFPIMAAAQDKAKLIIEPISGPAPWTSLEMNDDPSRFQFAIVTDRTGGHRPGVFMDGVNKLNLLQPEFVISVGDLIEGYTENQKELDRQWDEFDGFVEQLQMPFFYIPGNHDLTNQVMENLWHTRLGPTFYHFVYNDVLFLCLNTEDQLRGAGVGSISAKQFEYVEQVLKDNQNVKWTLLFMHQPLWHQKDTKKWVDVERLLASRKHTVFTGHEHRYVKTERNNGKYFVLATTGGGSRLRGPKLGEFDHVVWVTMTDQGPIVANIQLEGIWDENVVTQKVQDHLRMVAGKSPFKIEPVFIDSDDFEDANLEIKITNDEDVPLTVSLEEKFSFDLIGVLSQNELIVPPNSVKKTSLRLIKRNKAHSNPIGLEARINYQMDDLADLAIPFKWNIKPLKKHRISRTNSRIQIDGKDKEWQSYAHAWQSPGMESEIKFDVAHDDQYMYVAAYVLDDSVVSLGKGSIWRQDHLQISLNANALAKSAMSTGRGPYEFHLRITPEDKNLQSVLHGELPEGSMVKCVKGEEGFFTELAVPISYVKDQQGEEWKTVRLNIAFSDVDQTENKRYSWQPDWNGKNNVIGSGMFFRDGF